ncbi:hypothetical protein BD413DRAFT_465027 [Trametes elegans]|nr:hypothetical protein BD413DRAFT_465027 [Trametes elegans]
MDAPYAFATLVTSDHYLPGALAVAAALKELHASSVASDVRFQTVCLVTPETVDVSSVKLLRRAFDIVIGVEVIEQEDGKGLQLLGRPDLSQVLTKLHVFRLTQYSKIVFLDADVLPIRPLSHLFSIPHEFAAVPDVGWPDIFNSGVMVLTPGEDKFKELMELLKSKGTWDGGDQGLLNEWRGGNWHRLSFTYNTTPTAAYTYAPAYERYGSEISAIHFIGPNKPWNSVTYRAPGTKYGQGSTKTLDPKTPAYDYESLVDRWYDVYDRNYRSEEAPGQGNFEFTRYESVWDYGSGYGAEMGNPASAAPVAGGALGLDDLRKIAVEGIGSYNASAQQSEQLPKVGEYRSMPLEGRVDLMRPKRIVPPEPVEGNQEGGQDDGGDQNLTPRQAFRVFDGGDVPRMEPLPTPLPHEVLGAPHHAPLSLPPGSIFSSVHSPRGHHSPPHPRHSPPLHVHQPAATHAHHVGAPHAPHPHHAPQAHRPQLQHQPQHQPQNQHQHHEQGRSPSPPKLSWNPAIEPPPKTPPPVSAFPVDTYFPNVWDQAPSQEHDATHQSFPPHLVGPKSEVFFNPPPPAEIPEQLLREGQYESVIGRPSEQSPGSPPVPPTPDRSKIHAIFPWEEKPRPAPRRVFPVSDSPPPVAKFIDEPPSPKVLPRQERLAAQVHMPPPPIGLPFNLTYANAWDHVPSIQRYATKLVRPHHSIHQPPPPNYDEGWRRWDQERERVYQKEQDASSMDGDDEDEGDDDDDSRGPTTRWDSESSRERIQAPRSRSGSNASNTSAKGRKYRTRGIQTDRIETRNMGVQVNVWAEEVAAATKDKEPKPSRGTGMATRQWPQAPSGIGLLPPPTMRDFKRDLDQMAVGTPTVTQPPMTVMPFPSTASPTGLRSPQTLGSPRTYSPPRLPSPKLTRLTSPFSPPLQRTSSNDTALTSSPSTQGPVETPESTPVMGPMRKGGRVWDPARGVEVFKRSSEEVLARFLRSGSFDEEEAQRRQV